jgi:hypothetical protein
MSREILNRPKQLVFETRRSSAIWYWPSRKIDAILHPPRPCKNLRQRRAKLSGPFFLVTPGPMRFELSHFLHLAFPHPLSFAHFPHSGCTHPVPKQWSSCPIFNSSQWQQVHTSCTISRFSSHNRSTLLLFLQKGLAMVRQPLHLGNPHPGGLGEQ